MEERSIGGVVQVVVWRQGGGGEEGTGSVTLRVQLDEKPPPAMAADGPKDDGGMRTAVGRSNRDRRSRL